MTDFAFMRAVIIAEIRALVSISHLDEFVVDWMVQDRINNARHQVEEAIRRTEYIINQLQYM